MKLNKLTQYLDDLLNIHKIEDYSQNGLQVENGGEIHKVALAVDASLAAFKKTAELDADFLLVHHGLFWDKPLIVTGTMYPRIRQLLESNIALYAAHLPIDMHPELGNNAQLEEILGWPVTGDFGDYHGTLIGKEITFSTPKSLKEIVAQLKEGLHCEPVVWDFGAERIKKIGYVSGGAIDLLQQAIDQDMDALITGEPKHSLYWLAKEAGINVVMAGHYATETLGVKAVGERIQKEFDLETVFIDLPTGL